MLSTFYTVFSMLSNWIAQIVQHFSNFRKRVAYFLHTASCQVIRWTHSILVKNLQHFLPCKLLRNQTPFSTLFQKNPPETELLNKHYSQRYEMWNRAKLLKGPLQDNLTENGSMISCTAIIIYWSFSSYSCFHFIGHVNLGKYVLFNSDIL